MITKQDFIEIMNDVEKVYDYQTALNKFFKKNNVDGYIFQPDATPTVIRLLHSIFGDKDKDELISKFVFDYNFGKTFTDSSETNSVDLSTAESLYDYLIK